MHAAVERPLRELELRLNRPLLPREPVDAFVADWNAGRLFAALPQAAPELLVTITTYRRPQELAALLAQLADCIGTLAPTWFVCVLSDASDTDDALPRALLRERFGARAAWLDARRHMGKRLFWRTHQTIFDAARQAGATRLLSLQDDVALAPEFAPRLLDAWRRSGELDPRRRVLNLFAGGDDEPEGRWIRFARVEHPAAKLRRTDWFDLPGFVIDRAGLELLRYWVVPVPAARWRRDPTLSSGVGRQFTRRLAGRASVFQCFPPLLVHGAGPSLMNVEARARRAMDNRDQFDAPR